MSESGALAAQHDARAAERVEIEEKRSLLEHTEAACPLCGQELTAAHRKQVRAGFAARTSRSSSRQRLPPSRSRRRSTPSSRRSRSRTPRCAPTSERRETLAGQAAKLGQQLEQLGAARTKIEADRRSRRPRSRPASLGDDYAAGEREKLARVREELGARRFRPRRATRRLKDLLRAARDAERAIAAARRAEMTLIATRKEASPPRSAPPVPAKLTPKPRRISRRWGSGSPTLPALQEKLTAVERTQSRCPARFEEAAGRSGRTAHVLEALDRQGSRGGRGARRPRREQARPRGSTTSSAKRSAATVSRRASSGTPSQSCASRRTGCSDCSPTASSAFRSTRSGRPSPGA